MAIFEEEIAAGWFAGWLNMIGVWNGFVRRGTKAQDSEPVDLGGADLARALLLVHRNGRLLKFTAELCFGGPTFQAGCVIV